MDAVETLLQHQSIRNYTQEQISAEQMQKIEDAIIQTSSSCFLQLVTTIKVTDQEKKDIIAKLSGEQKNIATCSHFLLFCLDLTKVMHISEMRPPFSFKMVFMGINDCSLATQSALTAAEAMGLGGVVIGGYKQGMAKICELLKLPKGVVPLLGLCLGVPDKDYLEAQKPRLPRSWLIMENEFSDPFNEEEFKVYNETMRAYYQNRKHGARDSDWTETTLEYLEGQKQAKGIIDCLKAQGFDFF